MFFRLKRLMLALSLNRRRWKDKKKSAFVSPSPYSEVHSAGVKSEDRQKQSLIAQRCAAASARETSKTHQIIPDPQISPFSNKTGPGSTHVQDLEGF